ncbi:MAG TPA: hypothetical protein VF331_05235 [Polyangiales bacterium]
MFQHTAVHLMAFTAVLVALSGSASGSASADYRVIDLGGLSGAVSRGNAINNAGESLGNSSSASSALDAWLALHNLQTQVSFFAEADGTLHAVPGSGVALNNRGQVAGIAPLTDACGRSPQRAFLWSVRSGAQTLPPLPGDVESVATAINDAGAVVGYSVDANSTHHAVLWINRQPQTLGTPDGSTAIAINNQLQVLGYLAGGKKGAGYSFFLWTAANGYQSAPSLTRVGDQYSLATALNDHGQILGTSTDTNFVNHAVLWDSSVGLMDIGQVSGDTSSTPLGLNQQGDVLAVSMAASGSTSHYFLWDGARGVRAIAAGLGFTSVAGLNDHDDLVGTKPNRAGAPRAFTQRRGVSHELGTLGGDWSVGSALSQSGDVAGYALDVTGNVHGFRWTARAGLENLNDLDQGTGVSIARSINAQGAIVGTAAKTWSTRQRAFLWNPRTQMRDLGSLEGVDSGFSEAYGINARGQVVGFTTQSFSNGNSAMPPFLWDAATGMQALPLPANFLTFFSAPATAINDRTTVVGTGLAFSGDAGWIWDATKGSRELLSASGAAALPTALNNRDQVVGQSPVSTGSCGFATSHAFITAADGSVQDLGTLDGDQISVARAINLEGDVVGNSGSFLLRAFLYHAGRIENLTTLVADPQWLLQSAEAINDAGAITGVGLHHGQVHAFLLQPLPDRQH